MGSWIAMNLNPPTNTQSSPVSELDKGTITDQSAMLESASQTIAAQASMLQAGMDASTQVAAQAPTLQAAMAASNNLTVQEPTLQAGFTASTQLAAIITSPTETPTSTPTTPSRVILSKNTNFRSSPADPSTSNLIIVLEKNVMDLYFTEPIYPVSSDWYKARLEGWIALNDPALLESEFPITYNLTRNLPAYNSTSGLDVEKIGSLLGNQVGSIPLILLGHQTINEMDWYRFMIDGYYKSTAASAYTATPEPPTQTPTQTP
jgi:hypothetical protein